MNTKAGRPTDDSDDPVSLAEFFTEFERENPDFKQSWDDAAPSRLLADIVVGFRKMRGLTQRQLANRIGVQQPAVARIENASVNVGWETVLRVFSGLGIGMNLGPVEHELVVMPKADLEALVNRHQKKAFADGMAKAVSLIKARVSIGPTPDHPIVVSGISETIAP